MTKKTETLAVVTTKDIRRKIEDLSQKEDRSTSYIIHKALEEYFKNREEQHTPE